MSLVFTKPSNAEIRALVSSGLEGIEGVSNTVVKNIATSILNDLETRVNGYLVIAQKAIDDLQKEVDDVMATHNGAYEKDEETWKSKYDTATAELETAKSDLATEKVAHEATVTTHKQAATNATIDKLYADALTSAGLRPDLIANELKLANRELLTLDSKGVLKDTDKAIADAKTRWGEGDFAKETQGGARTVVGGAFGAKTPGNVSATDNKSMNDWIRGAADTAE